MGIRRCIFVFLRPPYHGGKDRPGRPGSREKEIEFERERERERYPSFQHRDAHALRFGSMNSISKVFGDAGVWMFFGGVSRIVSVDLGRI